MTRSIRIEVNVVETMAPYGQPFATRRFSATRGGGEPITKSTADISARLDGLEDGEHALEVADLSASGAVLGQPATGTITVGASTAPLTYMATKSLIAVVL